MSPALFMAARLDLGPGIEAVSQPVGEVWYAKSQAYCAMAPEDVQEFLFADPTQWWDNRGSGLAHKQSKVGPWLINRPWADLQVATWDAGRTKPCDPISTTVRGQVNIGKEGAAEDHLEILTCRKLCEDGPVIDAVDGLKVLVEQGSRVDNNLFYCVLKRCIADGDLGLGRRIHALTVQSGHEGDAFLATHLIGLYSSHGRLEEAKQVFTKACASVGVGALGQGQQLHAAIQGRGLHGDVVVGSSLVTMYSKCGSLQDARRVFDRLPARNVVTWTAMIAGYAQQGMGQEALSLYSSMQQEGLTPPDSVAYVCLLQACASVGVGALGQGQRLHVQIEERGLQGDLALGGSLVNMYAKCGSVEDARGVFDRLPARNVVSWTAMIAGYAQHGMGQEALSLYNNMQQDGLTPPDSVTYVSLLQACASVGVRALNQGKQLHKQIEKRRLQYDVAIGISLVNMYAKCGSLENARSVFDSLQGRDVVAWTAMIAGYAQQGMGQEALSLYNSMQKEGLTPNSVSYVCLLQACTVVAALPLGKQLHTQIKEQGLQADLILATALVNMYAKCGCMSDSQQAFNSMPERTIEAWGALSAGYAFQGDSEVVFGLLDQMRLEGLHPNGIVFLSVLAVCSHVGLVEKGRKYFEAMWKNYGISPTVEHYICMIDLLGRAGHLTEALHMAKSMPFPADITVWHTLLGACQKWNSVEIGQQVFESAVSVDGEDAACYVLMSNIYAGSQMWEAAKEMQERRVKSGAWKEPGQSWWTDFGGVVHTFVVGDKTHLESEGIHPRMK